MISDIPQVGCRMSSVSPEFAGQTSIFRPERCLSSPKRLELGGLCYEPAAVRRHIKWDIIAALVLEALAHLVGLIMQCAGGDASVVLQSILIKFMTMFPFPSLRNQGSNPFDCRKRFFKGFTFQRRVLTGEPSN